MGKEKDTGVLGPLELAIQIESGPPVNYQWLSDFSLDDPIDDTLLALELRKRGEKNVFDCTTFTVWLLEACGNDLNKYFEIEAYDGCRYLTTLRRFVMIHRETLLAEEKLQGVSYLELSAENQRRVLAKLVSHDDERIKGVFHLSSAGFGTEIDRIENLRPGDFIQTWKGDLQGGVGGHATQVRYVFTDDGKRLDENSMCLKSEKIKVVEVALIGCHLRYEDAVYTKGATDLSDCVRWYAVRPIHSPWC